MTAERPGGTGSAEIVDAVEEVEPAAGQVILPAEGVLLDELVGADLKAKVHDAWHDFTRALAMAVPTLPAGTTLDLTLDPSASGTGDAVYAVRVRVDEDGELVGAAVGNSMLPEGYRLERGAVAELVALGWSPPGVVKGSGEFFGLRLPATSSARLAVIVARTMRDVYGAPHPAFLTYEVEGADESAGPDLAPLASARALPAGSDAELDLEVAEEELMAAIGRRSDADLAGMPLEERVATVVAGLLKTPREALQVDSDGDISIRSGSAMVFVRVRDNPPLVDVFSPVLTEVRPTEQLYVRLSELTNRMPIGRLYCTADTVWASVPVFGRDFQPTHLMLAVQVMTGLADELDDRLHGEFGGKRFFSEGDKPAARGGHERTGMYL